MNVITTGSEKQIEIPRENDKMVEKSSGEKNVEIEENSPTPPEKKVVKEVEKEASYVVPPPYKPPIYFL